MPWKRSALRQLRLLLRLCRTQTDGRQRQNYPPDRRDEALHLTGTQHMLNLLRSGSDDPEMAEIAEECKQECYDLFVLAAQQEKEWADYLFRDGSMIGLNKDILCQYVEYITNIRMQAVGLDLPFQTRSNLIPWINTWLVSDNVQVAPQEVEVVLISSARSILKSMPTI